MPAICSSTAKQSRCETEPASTWKLVTSSGVSYYDHMQDKSHCCTPTMPAVRLHLSRYSTHELFVHKRCAFGYNVAGRNTPIFLCKSLASIRGVSLHPGPVCRQQSSLFRLHPAIPRVSRWTHIPQPGTLPPLGSCIVSQARALFFCYYHLARAPVLFASPLIETFSTSNPPQR